MRRDWENLSPTGLRMMINQRFSELTAMYQRSERFTAADIVDFQRRNEELAEMRLRWAELQSHDDRGQLNAEQIATLRKAGLITTNEAREAIGLEAYTNQYTNQNVYLSSDETREAMNQLRDSAYDAGDAISKLSEVMNESSPVHEEVQRRMKAMKDKQQEWTDEMYAEKFRRKRRYHKD